MNKKLAILLSIALLTWVVLLSVDNFRAERNQAPLFCVEVPLNEVDESTRYIGLFYQVYHVIDVDSGVEPIEIDYGYYVVPWFVTIKYIKQMLGITSIT